MQASSSLGFGGTASRPSRSVMSTSRMSSTRALPAARSRRVRHRLHVHRQLLELVDDLEAPAARDGRQREQHTRHAELVDEVRQVLRRMHLEPVDDGAPKRGVVVDERDRHELAAPLQRRDEMRAGIAGAVDNDRVAGGVTRLAGTNGPSGGRRRRRPCRATRTWRSHEGRPASYRPTRWQRTEQERPA